MATLVFPDHPSPVADAEAIYNACKGWGTHEKTVIGIIGHRNWTQRKLIKQAYHDQYQEDLIRRFEKELSGSLEKAVYRLMLDPEDRDAVLLNVAIRKGGVPDYRVIIEQACIYCPEEFLGVKRAYQARYKRSFEEDLAQNSTADFRKLLVALVGVYRYSGSEVDAKLAQTESLILHNAIKKKEYNHEEIVRILSTRSKAQLIATFNRYKDEHGTAITKDLKEDTGNQYLTALRSTIRAMVDPHKYYEKLIRRALTKTGADEDDLTRVIVTRAERDLRGIKEVYQKRNSVTLEQAVAKETSGHYEALLLALLGKQE
ncbi:PREDICTED: annexin-like protein RJ4 [Ipomoea nil]|uniref:annexin-like protein RJ4 n=1 Tax=Ipomoea nil TaxID=35883 RepID=UPI0009009C21|nr:PREDICTED: annexin-like protein RJ4 [Ipomoea nil]